MIILSQNPYLSTPQALAFSVLSTIIPLPRDLQYLVHHVSSELRYDIISIAKTSHFKINFCNELYLAPISLQKIVNNRHILGASL